MSRNKYNTETDEQLVSENLIENGMEISEENNVKTDAEETARGNVISCKVVKIISKDKGIINFDGCGIIVPVGENTKLVNIRYTGKIGKSDFKCVVV